MNTRTRTAWTVIVAATGSLAPVATSQAQEITSYGLRAGLSRATMELSPLPNWIENRGRRYGFALGGFAMIGLKPGSSFALQPEALLVQNGMSWQQDAGTLDGSLRSVTLKANYLEFAALGRLAFAAAGDTKPFLLFGPSLVFNLSASYSPSGADVEGWSGNDFDFQIGGGASKGMWSAEVRWSMGLMDVDTDQGEATHRTLSVLASYTLPRSR